MRRTTAFATGLALFAVVGLPAPAHADPTPPTTTTTTTTTPGTSTTTTVATHPRRARPPGAAHARATTPSATVTITSNSSPSCSLFCYSPADTTIAAGGTVTFVNQTGVDHTVARCSPSACNGASGGTGNDPAFGSSVISLAPGKSSSVTFTNTGTYVFSCTIHGYAVMHGTITVTAATPATTATTSPAPAPATTAAPASNVLASTGDAWTGPIVAGMVILVLGLAAIGFGTRRRADRAR